MSTTYQVGPNGPTTGSKGQAIFQPGRQHDGVAIFNIGATTVYLDNENQQTRPTDGIPLSPGSSIPWDKDLPLFAACPTAGTLLITDNTAIPFDAGAIADALNQDGLAQDIADAIHISGVPPVDRFTGLASQTVVNGSVTAMFDMSGYQSVFFGIVNFGAMVAGTIEIDWYADAGGATIVGVDSFMLGAGVYSQASYPARGPFMQIIVTATSGSAQLDTFGSYKALTAAFYSVQGNGASAGVVEGNGTLGVQTWSGNIPIGQTWTWQPDIVAGRSLLIMRYTNTSAVTLLARAPLAIFALTTYAATPAAMATTAGMMTTYDLLFPPIPFELSLANASGSATLNFRATLTPLRPF